ncbi:30S ribosomal protein S20 [Rubripirellula tenax]|uniref:Small ribosomal subunit protein bS20 n=1 Tax=Rubripirellula tenax TaxID=2528015 RepID=A0A5C6F073_9BACT|nr:30S ribosomal protein S20 [Rubripirellula tenax]TWU54682.1 30S ribosomal protein S20 [Rubripirellula tenax]
MPNTASAKKRLRQNEKLRISNRAKRSTLRGQLRRVRDAVKAGDSDAAQAELRIAQKRIDQAAAKNLLHQNTADRTKRRLNKIVKAIAK